MNAVKSAFALVHPGKIVESLRMRPPHAALRTAYANGLRYCAHCRYWVKAQVNFCPLCGKKYRRSVRRKRNKTIEASRARTPEEMAAYLAREVLEVTP
jgi:hypothetical protein